MTDSKIGSQLARILTNLPDDIIITPIISANIRNHLKNIVWYISAHDEFKTLSAIKIYKYIYMLYI